MRQGDLPFNFLLHLKLLMGVMSRGIKEYFIIYVALINQSLSNLLHY
jgi:hypothetical protein